MATQVQNRRGSTAEHSTFTGAVGEVTVDTDKDVVVVHDGTTAGGYPQMRENGSNSALALGSAATPSLKFTGDTNTGIYSPGADQVAISTGGSGRLFVDASGRIGAGVASPGYPLDLVSQSGESIRIRGTSGTEVSKLLFTSNSAGADYGWLSSASSYLAFGTAASERMRLTSTGLGIGTSSPISNLHVKGGASGTNIRIEGNASTDYTFLQAINTSGVEAQLAANGTDSARLLTNSNHPLDFFTNGTRAIRIDTSQRVGIGTASPDYTLHTQGTVGIGKVGASGAYNLFWAPNTVGQSVRWIRNNAGELAIGEGTTAGTNEQFRFDASGRLLVGTSTSLAGAFSDQALLQSSRADGGAQASFQRFTNDVGGVNVYLYKSRGATTNTNTIVQNGDGCGAINFAGADGTTYHRAAIIAAEIDGTPGTNDMPGRLVFSTTADGASSPTERMRITSNGNLFVNTTTPLINESQISASGSGNTACLKTTVSGNNPLLLWNSATSGDNIFCSFFTEASFTGRGTIDYNRGAGQVRYNTTSDRRLKSDIASAPTALSKLNEIKVKSYKWTETDYLVEYGFIAQELNVVLPDAVKKGDDGDEVVEPWAVDNSKLVPLLTKALQEAITKIETLEARLTALESA